MDLKLLAKSLGLPIDATEVQVLEKIESLKQEASDGLTWKARAEDNLTKLEKVTKLGQENEELRADAVLAKAKTTYKITAAEEVALKEMYLSGPTGRAAVEKLLKARADHEYMVRSSALENVREAPTDPLAEIEGRAAELMSKDSNLSKSSAHARVLASDPKLAEEYRALMLSGGDR